MRISIILILLLLSFRASSQEMVFLEFREDCNLYTTEGNKIAAGAQLETHCTALLENYRNRYSFCALAGAGSEDVGTMCSVGYWSKMNKGLGFFGKPKTLCRFVCLEK